MLGDAELAAPSLFNTNSKYLNNPYFRDAFVQVALRRNGPDVPSTYIMPMVGKAIGEVTDYAEFQRLIDAERARNPEFAGWLDARRFTIFRAENVAAHAPGTLGHMIWSFLVESDFAMDKMQMSDATVTNDIDYITQRRAGIHDIEHMVTGFSANNAGEMALSWQNVTSYTRYFSPELARHIYLGLNFLLSARLSAYALRYPAAYSTILDAARRGIEMGMALRRPTLLEPWEDMLDWPIEDIRSHLGIEPGPGCEWDWITAATTG
jgi:ubiquinone biosynthesis protein Coq4